MGSILSKPKPAGPSAEELALQEQRKKEQERAEAERTRQVQESLKKQTLVMAGGTGRRSLLSKGSTGFSNVALRSLLGGS